MAASALLLLPLLVFCRPAEGQQQQARFKGVVGASRRGSSALFLEVRFISLLTGT